MTAQLLQMLRPATAKLECSNCGAPGEGTCDCGVSYLPAGAKAAAAVAANPEKSNRAIADEIDVDEGTVRKARKSGADHSAPAGSEYSEPGRRTGKDGKSYPAKVTPKTDWTLYHSERWRRETIKAAKAYPLLRADSALVTPAEIAAVREVVAAWTTLADQLEAKANEPIVREGRAT